jgi:ABC-2 type transport system permease protein
MEALDAGKVSAILTIPPGFIADLQTGVSPPVVGLITSRRSPIESSAIERRLQAAIYRLNQNLASTYVQQTLQLVDLVVNGGSITIFGISGKILGLEKSREILGRLQSDLRARGEGALASRLDPLVRFIDATLPNLRLAGDAANAIRSPIQLRISKAAPGREPVSAFGFAGALLVSVGLVGVLIAAAALSSEREDNALVRLGRGLVSPGALVAEKVVFAALACVVVGLVLLGAVAVFTSLAIGRWALWLATLALAGLGFGAFGVLVGAVARETRTALLAGLMLALPLLFLGLVPSDGIAHAVVQVVVFGPAFEAFRTLLVEPTVPGSLALTLGQLALITAVFSAAAALALARRSRV